MLDPLTFWGKQLDQFGLRFRSVVITSSGGSSPGSFDGHVPLLAMLMPPVRPVPGGSALVVRPAVTVLVDTPARSSAGRVGPVRGSGKAGRVRCARGQDCRQRHAQARHPRPAG